VNREAMQENLRKAGDWVLAEPLYILLALRGRDANAYDRVRELVRAAERNKRSLAQELKATPELQTFLESLSGAQRRLLENPADYIGDSVRRTHVVCELWEARLASVTV